MKKFNTEQPDAEDAKVTQKTQKEDKKKLPLVFDGVYISVNDSMNLVFILRPLRNLCVFCVRKFLSPLQQLQQGAKA
jgi:hypothetical protein